MSLKQLSRQKLSVRTQSLLIAAAMLGISALAAWNVLGGLGMLVLAAGVAFFVLPRTRESASASRAPGRPLARWEAPRLYDIVEALARRAGLAAVPRVYLLPSRTMNAAAFGGEEEPAILVTQGLAGALTERELAGVLAHEIAHIRNRDLRLFAFAEVTKMLAYFVSRIGWFMLLIQFPLLLLGQALLPLPAVLLLAAGPSMVLLLQLALLRTREFAADLTAVELSGDPIALASALRRIERPRLRIFDYVLPLPEPAREPANPLRTHPSTEERVRRLSALAAA